MSEAAKRTVGRPGSLLHKMLLNFVKELNRIEGIDAVSDAEVGAHERLLLLSELSIEDIEAFVSVVAPGKVLRVREGMNVRVGRYIAPEGGPWVRSNLAGLLHKANRKMISPYLAHVDYEKQHPFQDGNGRSGRAIWLWMHEGHAPLGFLHKFYYETLEAA